MGICVNCTLYCNENRGNCVNLHTSHAHVGGLLLYLLKWLLSVIEKPSLHCNIQINKGTLLLRKNQVLMIFLWDLSEILIKEARLHENYQSFYRDL